MEEHLTYSVVFIQGLATFASPCVLPLIPAYFSHLTGSTIDQIENDKKLRVLLFINALGFVIGLSMVFILLGATATTLGRFLTVHLTLFKKISGVLIFIMGIHFLGVLKIPFLNYEKRWIKKSKTPNFLNAVLLGGMFAFGWTPCFSPILGSVLMMAANARTFSIGIGYLIIYSLGMSMPFLIIGGVAGFFIPRLNKLFKYFNIIKIISGMIMIIMGILIYSNYLTKITYILQ